LKEAREFENRNDLELGAITAVVDNCAMMTVLNNKSLFIGDLELILAYRIVTVSGTNYKSTYVGTA